MPIYGIDISHHQAGINLQQVKNEGFQYVIARVGQGAGGQYGTTQDREWRRHRDECRRVNLRLCAYWYIGNNISAWENARLCALWMGDNRIPVALDCEAGSGNIAFYREVLENFRRAGLWVNMSYIPRWYWQQVGSSSLAGLPPLWSSRYVNGSGTAAQLYPGDSSTLWNNYGGNEVKILQFTSSAQVAGRTVDANAFKGNLAQLDALLFGIVPPVDAPLPPPVEEPDMQLTDVIGRRADGSPITVGDALRAASNPGTTKQELEDTSKALEGFIKGAVEVINNRSLELLKYSTDLPTWKDLENTTWGELETKTWGKIV